MRITVLSNQITGITGKIDIIYLSSYTRPHRNHFADISKMVGHIFTCIRASSFRFIDDGLKVSPLGITQ